MSPKRRVYWIGEDGESHDLPLEDADPLPKVGDVIQLTGEQSYRVVEVAKTDDPNSYELVVEPAEQA